jgi:hypothetical protein
VAKDVGPLSADVIGEELCAERLLKPACLDWNVAAALLPSESNADLAPSKSIQHQLERILRADSSRTPWEGPKSAKSGL